MILQEAPNVWYAQGLEVDYIAQGATLEEAQAAFELGLSATVGEVLRLYGDIQRLLRPAPPETWAEFFQQGSSGQYSFTQLSTHKLEKAFGDAVFVATTKPRGKPKRGGKQKRERKLKSERQPLLPFENITYLAQCA